MTTRQDMTPFSRTEMCNLHVIAREEKRLKQVAQIVKDIYMYTVAQASMYDATVCNYLISDSYMQPALINERKFYMANIPDIVAGLQPFFPDSTITLRSVIRKEGVETDICKLNGFLIGQRLDYLVIDWTP
jgi:hypothetical protein